MLSNPTSDEIYMLKPWIDVNLDDLGFFNTLRDRMVDRTCLIICAQLFQNDYSFATSFYGHLTNWFPDILLDLVEKYIKFDAQLFWKIVKPDENHYELYPWTENNSERKKFSGLNVYVYKFTDYDNYDDGYTIEDIHRMMGYD
jgi:hypothetical protein